MTDDGFEDFLRRTAREYREPPATPREEMWARISAERRSPTRRATPWFQWVTAAAAMLALGIGIGWQAAHVRQARPGFATASDAQRQVSGGGYDLAAAQYLGRTEALLTDFVIDARQGARERAVSTSARDLLTTNRLLQDSPAADDPQMKALLQDLELVLAQIARVSAEHGQKEVNLIVQGLNQSGVMVRLRAAIPAGPALPPSQEISSDE
ncbi:MAG TPA: hypothetical protein VGI83_05345 [Gemmatimonadales bacterium]|jgi:hypothetical protein